MHSHDDAAMGRTRVELPAETEWAEWVRDYCIMLESSGLAVGRIWFSALHFNVLFVATRPK
jgi:hypothetical protein